MMIIRKRYNHCPEEVIAVRRRDRRGCLNMERRPPRRAFLDVDELEVQEFGRLFSGEAYIYSSGSGSTKPSKQETLRRQE
ncbi:MAG: hypothetical protein QHG99_05880 [Methanomicrobiales archaeon]|jgi:hypothetical protein|nr:hypothetical protein [Methanomicrobiales archaeon]